jgi:hypothetical protein
MPEFTSAYFGSRSLKSNIGSMTVKCNFCNALKFKGEPDGLCCQEGAVSLPLPRLPPQPLWDLFNGSHQHSNFFRENIRAFNQALSFASLKANQDHLALGGPPTFRVHVQIYHNTGPLLLEILRNLCKFISMTHIESNITAFKCCKTESSRSSE